VLVDVVLMGVMQMPRVKVVKVVAVAYRDVPTTGAMDVGMVFMGLTGHRPNIQLGWRQARVNVARGGLGFASWALSA
jgi:hypothetical protein